MDSGTIDEVTEWDSARAGAGFDGLRGLAEQDFSGAVTADGTTWAFLLNGNVVGVFDGTIETFEGADLSAYAAPDPALPLLFAMQEQGGETRAKYYTNDTPLSEADKTLSSGNFTGYVQLSENVLSGDYYVVYYGGKSMSVAFVGNSGRLISGDEAFERANGEVGIYEVKEASIDVVDVPESAAETAADESTAGGSESGPGATAGDADPETEADAGSVTIDSATDASADPAPTADEPTTPTQSGSDAAETPGAVDETAADASVESTGDEDASATQSTGGDEREPVGDPGDDAGTATTNVESGASDVETGGRTETDEAVEASSADADAPREAGADSSRRPEREATSANGDGDAAPGDDVFSEEERWREAQEIPALDPEETPGSASEAAVQRTRRAQGNSRTPANQRQSNGSSDRQSARRGAAQRSEGVDPKAVEKLKRKLKAAREAKEQLEAERDQLATERDRLVAERDEAASERDEYEAEVERLRETVSELESELEAMERRLDEAGVTTAERTMSPAAALEGTNLFVRYHSKSDGTLEDAHKGDATREEVNENLRLEHHTTFESDGVTVEGRPFVEYLHDTVEYGFVRWVVRNLLYEITETGNRNGLDQLYDVIPEIDRAELQGEVSLEFTEDGEEIRQQQSFDVVLRNRMGNPLIVANLNDSRTEATENMMTGLIENASLLRESSESFGAAFLVTSSFFDPGALEAAAEATGGGLLSRSKRKSFVKVSRKRGYHLCLVEARNGEFHVNVPEL